MNAAARLAASVLPSRQRHTTDFFALLNVVRLRVCIADAETVSLRDGGAASSPLTCARARYLLSANAFIRPHNQTLHTASRHTPHLIHAFFSIRVHFFDEDQTMVSNLEGVHREVSDRHRSLPPKQSHAAAIQSPFRSNLAGWSPHLESGIR